MTVPPRSPTAADRPGRRSAAAWRAAHVVAGCVLLLIAGVALLAWARGGLEYLQVDASFLPLHYNTALGVAAWGLAYLSLAVGRPWAARVGAAAVGAVGMLLLAAHLGLVPGLARWAVAPPTSPAFPRGGASLWETLCLLLGAASLQLVARARLERPHTLALSVVGLVLVLGSALVFALALTSPTAPQAPRVALLGVIAAGVAGVPPLTAAIRAGRSSRSAALALPLGVGLVGVVFTILLWAALDVEQSRRISRQTQFEADKIQRSGGDRLNELVRSLGALAQGWTQDPDRVKQQVGVYAGQNPDSCLAVGRVEPGGAVRWLEQLRRRQPLPAEPAGLGLAEAIGAGAREGRVVVSRPPRSAWDGERVLAIFAPERPGAAASPGLLAVFRIPQLFADAVQSSVAADYAFTVSDGDEQLYSRYPSDAEPSDWRQALRVGVQDAQWRLEAWPTRAALQRENLWIPKLSLLVGLGTTCLLGVAVHLAQTAARRARELEKEVRQRELAQRALELSEGRYRCLIENLGQGIFLQDRDHKYVAANPQFCRSVGRAEADVIGRTEADLFDAPRADKYAAQLRRLLEAGGPLEDEEELVADGRRRWVRRVLTPVRNTAGEATGVLGICWDVTEQRQLEAHVRQAGKMDAIGQLAGGIAHDFNNLLTVINGFGELLHQAIPAGDARRELVEEVRKAGERAAGLTRQLLTFSRRQVVEPRVLDLNAVVADAEKMLRRLIGEDVALTSVLAERLPRVKADPGQVEQVLMNLCVNARDAMPTGGQLTIATTAVELGRSQAAVAPGRYVVLAVSDTGCGMDQATKARVFEPFFTTKGVGRGTGLGLATVYGIVQQAGGHVRVDSEPGRGTTFTIHLPAVEAADPEANGAPIGAAPAGGHETVLLLEDDAAVRSFARQALQARGYAVLEACDGEEALRLAAAHRGPIDLLVTDVVMPGMGGRAAAERLGALRPGLKVLFVSGYTDDAVVRHGVQSAETAFLQKPFSGSALANKVRDVLGAAPPARRREPAVSV